MLRLLLRIGSALAPALLCVGAAWAQAQQPQAVPPTDVSRQSGTLSDKLEATKGVIHPEGSVDPKMEKDAPSSGRMPVIPPPGTPGGAPDVQPK